MLHYWDRWGTSFLFLAKVQFAEYDNTKQDFMHAKMTLQGEMYVKEGKRGVCICLTLQTGLGVDLITSCSLGK